MSEIEAAAIGGLGGWFGRHKPVHNLPISSPCPNCATLLQGPWCYACGQVAEDYHRSVAKLVMEVVESFTHLDGRFWRTVPQLISQPASLTSRYIEGHRAAQIPPLRLFLVVLLLVFLMGSVTGGGSFGHGLKDGWNATPNAASPVVTGQPKPGASTALNSEVGKTSVTIAGRPSGTATRWFRERAKRALENPEAFWLVVEQWAERFAFLMLPIAATLLSLLFVFQRRFYVFDHTIFALHSLSFQGMLLTVVFALTPLGDWPNWLVLVAPVHLFVHMRGVYGSSVLGTLTRMVLLGFGSLFGFVVLTMGLLWVGLSALGTA